MQVQISKAMFNKIQTLVDMKLYDVAIQLTNDFKTKFSPSENKLISHDLGDLMVNKSGIFAFSNTLPASIIACDEAYQMFIFSKNNKMLLYAIKALVNKANYLIQLKKYEDALQICEQVINSYKKSAEPLLRDQVSKAEKIKSKIVARSHVAVE